MDGAPSLWTLSGVLEEKLPTASTRTSDDSGDFVAEPTCTYHGGLEFNYQYWSSLP